MVATELLLSLPGMEELVNHIKGSQIDPEGLHDYMKEEIDKLKEEKTTN